MRACSVDGCVKPVRSRGWCGMHYERWRRGLDVGGPDELLDRRPAVERLWTDRRLEGDCLVYTGGHVNGRSGHRMVWDRDAGRYRIAHRVLWEHLHGPIPEGLVVRHSCDNPPCVNPDHLLLGTVADNNRDRDERGRHVALKGEANGTSKLTDEKVRQIRRLAARGIMSQKAIGERFGVSQRAVWSILAGKSWTHVSDGHYVAELNQRGAA